MPLQSVPSVNRRLFSVLALLLFARVELTATPRSDRPNVILICADDLGIGLLGCYGQQLIKTPHIDRLAAEGMKFTNHYGSVLCAPARWSLLTGMHDGRIGGWDYTAGGLVIKRDSGEISEAEYQTQFAQIKADAPPIADHEVFIAQLAQKAGYRTAQFGKLDNGFLTWPERVARYGWDFHEGYYDHARCHGFYPPYLWRNGEKFDLPGNPHADAAKMSEAGNEPVGSGGATYSQNIFIAGILKFIREHKEEPFFLYHPTQLPHGPVAIPTLHPDFANHPTLTLGKKKYASMVKMLDDHVGLIMQELKTQGIDDNTVVVFTSDNGHELYYGPKSNYAAQRDLSGEKANLTDHKWRTSEQGDVFDGSAHRAGLKRSAYQGGMQCPLIVRWPGQVAAGQVTDHFSANYDFLATLADIVQVTPPAGKDSLSFLPTLLGQTPSKVHDYLVIDNRFHRMGRSALIGRDGWKLVEIDRSQNDFQLYNLNDDNEERHDLASEYPQQVQAMQRILLEQLGSARPDLAPDSP